MQNDLNENRLSSLRLLIAIYGGKYGAPSSGSFLSELSSAGFEMDDSTLSNILCRKKKIDDAIANKIERYLHLKTGWLSIDHTIGVFASQDDLIFLETINKLPTELSLSLSKIISALGVQK